jgi:hypothetical protein
MQICIIKIVWAEFGLYEYAEKLFTTYKLILTTLAVIARQR